MDGKIRCRKLFTKHEMTLFCLLFYDFIGVSSLGILNGKNKLQIDFDNILQSLYYIRSKGCGIEGNLTGKSLWSGRHLKNRLSMIF
jgi:hypothetical protein